MRLLHTGDWHLGKRLYGADRAAEAEAALDELVALADAERVDAVLVAGDLLDRRLVDSAALGACLRALERLAEVAPVVAVTGNHDDPDLWTHLAPYLAARRIHVSGRVRPPAEAVATVATDAGPLHAAMLPWADPARMQLGGGAAARDARVRWADGVGELVRRYSAEAAARRREAGGAAVLVGHLMIERALAGGGERELTMGISYVVSSAALPADLDYIALGHVHRPQPLPGVAAPGRYCGSPMALDFSEDNHPKSAVIAEVAGDTTTVREVPLTAAAPLVRIRGPLGGLGALASAHPAGAWFACEVELEGPVMDLVRQVRDAVPRALRVEAVYPQAAAAAGDEGGGDGGDGPARSLPDLYAEWVARGGRELTAARASAFAAAIAGAGSPDDEG
ncbi:metallophosphoesterase family protein [Miltoncostaea marina]|uniref:metallophosphoesterase family protein n=1 Tax=Miltoncostaea marina TaxID=2843215 RepID=UPI001C3CB68D|nr:DNA repair exonuclease [Miltoncostaea marina]